MTNERILTTAPFPAWAVRHARWLLVAMHLPFVVQPPLLAITRRPNMPVAEMLVVAATGGAVGALQLRHSLAAAGGTRPPRWAWTYTALVALAYVPARWFALDWAGETQWFVLASAAMLLPRRAARAAVVGAIAITAVMGRVYFDGTKSSVTQIGIWIVYLVAVAVMGGASLYGSARLVGVLEQLAAARTELAERALGRERLRMSRDLHDLLGSSLSAVSLKGDLAIRLLSTNTLAAVAEIESLTVVARGALRDMRAVTRDEHTVSLRAEVDVARSVLEAAGIQARTSVELGGLRPPIDGALGWAVREGVTNVLRHSDAVFCSISALHRDGMVTLEIINDGATGTSRDGNGLVGLAQRFEALNGSAVGAYVSHSRFRLVASLPDGF